MQFGFSKAHHTPRGKLGVALGLRDLPKIWVSPIICLQRLKVATLRLANRWALLRPITKPHPVKSGRGHGLGELPKILGFLFNISATTEARTI